jgi:hypothetical protein
MFGVGNGPESIAVLDEFMLLETFQRWTEIPSGMSTASTISRWRNA